MRYVLILLALVLLTGCDDSHAESTRPSTSTAAKAAPTTGPTWMKAIDEGRPCTGMTVAFWLKRHRDDATNTYAERISGEEGNEQWELVHVSPELKETTFEAVVRDGVIVSWRRVGVRPVQPIRGSYHWR